MFDGIDPAERNLPIPRAILLFVAALYPTMIVVAMGLALWQGWPWWGWTLAAAGACWSAPLAWGARVVARRHRR